ncbi:MAG: polysaccharide biosynthesis C-terminal domain-containing protein, partial [Clostridia bacterium]|nr:polysaccharide biosynthesis C-terminal domain-containing protein [Clostridia bacterium]
AVMRLAVGLACAGVFAKHGDGMIAAGAAAGVAAGEICALVCLLPMLFRQCVRIKRSDISVFPELARIALPLTFGSVIHTVVNIADIRILLSSLQISGLSGSAATELYGIYSGYCMTLFSFPPTLIAALTASLLPAAAALHAEKNREGLSRLAERAMKTALFVAAPCTAGFLSIPRELLSLLFRRSGDVAIAAPLLASIAPGIIFLAVSAVCRTLLISSGKAAKSVGSTLFAAIIRIAVTALAARIPGIGIFGAALASGAALLVQAVVDLVTLRRMQIVSFRLRAFMPAILLSLPLVIISPCMLRLLTPCLGADKATVFAVLVSAAVYLICGTFFGFINPSALLTLKTPKIVKCKKC